MKLRRATKLNQQSTAHSSSKLRAQHYIWSVDKRARANTWIWQSPFSALSASDAPAAQPPDSGAMCVCAPPLQEFALVHFH